MEIIIAFITDSIIDIKKFVYLQSIVEINDMKQKPIYFINDYRWHVCCFIVLNTSIEITEMAFP